MLGHMTSIGHKLRRTLAGVFLLAVGARVASAQQTDSLDQAAADLRQEDRLLNRRRFVPRVSRGNCLAPDPPFGLRVLA